MNDIDIDIDIDRVLRDYYKSIAPADSTRATTLVAASIRARRERSAARDTSVHPRTYLAVAAALIVAIVAVFIAGLMVGRTPEYLHKKITGREIKLVSLYILTTPVIVLIGTGIAMSVANAKASILNPGPHGLSEVLYAFMSTANNNGSAFAGLSGNTNFYNIALGLAGSLARQRSVPATAGTLPTHTALFVLMLAGVIIIVAGLTFFPALALGPLAEGL